MITEIKWNNHPVLGNLELNFTKPDGTPYNTIVIAGENGTGKTTIVSSIIDLYKKVNKLTYESLTEDVMLLAPTGRAAKRMSESSTFKSSVVENSYS